MLFFLNDLFDTNHLRMYWTDLYQIFIIDNLMIDLSTTCALTCLLHHVTNMLERCSYVRCLMIDFRKAFDRVNHAILYGKLAGLGLPDHVISWIHSFLTDRTQVVSYNIIIPCLH